MLRLAFLLALAVCAFGQRRQLFNGTDLEGWQFAGRQPGAKGFHVSDRLLKTSGDKGMLWYTREKIGNAKLRVVYMMSNEKGNSGVFIRIPVEPKSETDAIHRGIEVQIDDRDNDWHSTGTLYSMTKAKARPSRPPGQWNIMEIVMDGPRTLVTVNGVLVTDYDGVSSVPPRKFPYEPERGPRPDTGYIGLQNHDPSAVISFREISVEPLSPSMRSALAFNGRWTIDVDAGRGRVWWLKLSGAGTEGVKGEFVGAPGGGLDPIPELLIHDGELSFKFRRSYGQGSQEAIYRARVVDGQLKGTYQAEGSTRALNWTGKRAPEILDEFDNWTEDKPVSLFNGRDLSGWRIQDPNRRGTWQVVNGVLRNDPAASDIATEQRFWNFKLHAEYRLTPHTNAGFGLRGRYEVQVLEDYGRPASNKGHGALYSRILPAQNASKPAGEWQSLDVTLIGRRLDVVLNGVKIIEGQEIEGFTAIATAANEGEPGPITIQGDHGSVEYRNLRITPLKKQARSSD